MKLDKIIEAAEKIGFSRTHSGVVRLWLCNAQDLEKLVKLAVQREREACAKVCESMPYRAASASKAAEAIRARGEA